MGRVVSILVVLMAIAAATVVRHFHEVTHRTLPAHMLHHPVIDKPNFLSPDVTRRLRELTRKVGRIPSSIREGESMKLNVEHIGEAEPFDGKSCGSKLLVPNSDRTKCIFPQRIDVGRAYILSGGPDGLKEPFETLATRLQSFLAYLFNYTQYEVAKELLDSPEFIDLAKNVCPKDQQYIDPVQLNLIAQVPGQTVATHIDAPYFWGANRFNHPMWLLAAMVFSGLFEDRFINQVQVVGYYHKWTDPTHARAGRFLFWNTESSTPHIADPEAGSANSVDGSKTVHGAGVYMPDRVPPRMDPSNANDLVFDAATGNWSIISNGKVLETYVEDDLRFSVVYRARCFASEEERNKYHSADPKVNRKITVEEILAVFRKDLDKRGLLGVNDAIAPYDLGVLIVNTYAKYPLSPSAWIPYNYCALPRLYPWSAPLLALFC